MRRRARALQWSRGATQPSSPEPDSDGRSTSSMAQMPLAVVGDAHLDLRHVAVVHGDHVPEHQHQHLEEHVHAVRRCRPSPLVDVDVGREQLAEPVPVLRVHQAEVARPELLDGLDRRPLRPRRFRFPCRSAITPDGSGRARRLRSATVPPMSPWVDACRAWPARYRRQPALGGGHLGRGDVRTSHRSGSPSSPWVLLGDLPGAELAGAAATLLSRCRVSIPRGTRSRRRSNRRPAPAAPSPARPTTAYWRPGRRRAGRLGEGVGRRRAARSAPPRPAGAGEERLHRAGGAHHVHVQHPAPDVLGDGITAPKCWTPTFAHRRSQRPKRSVTAAAALSTSALDATSTPDAIASTPWVERTGRRAADPRRRCRASPGRCHARPTGGRSPARTPRPPQSPPPLERSPQPSGAD